MFINTLDPIVFSVGLLSIRWYGIMYVLAFLFTYWYISRRIATGKTTITREQLDSICFWLIIALIVGARIFAVFIWHPEYYLAHPFKIFAIWEGGLSFHGSLLAMVLVAWWIARKYKVQLLHLADIFVVPLSLGQAFGRVGNFFNHELYGSVTSLPWGVNFNNETDAMGYLVFRHPSQLYEVAYNIVIFLVLWKLKDRGFKTGTLFSLWLVMYAVARISTEFIRVGEPQVLWLTMGQWFSLVMLFTGSGILYWTRRTSR